ncbi:hypothetical protein [Stenotrophomonas sp. CFBP 13718]|uniref:hypothetical protein n=1 Tax=Stenotrophomonas sp. CFBP 13718 TaxID=2775304 RepID=UPI00177CB3EA|nr:hypothetical protein [Stenotrophomonas sp. CFBP 13718]MBD8697619.1 hypothetical protein [Stenotrophomonas sp. CFBP 13718]
MRFAKPDHAAIEEIIGTFEALASLSKHAPKQCVPRWFAMAERAMLWLYLVATACVIVIALLSRLGRYHEAINEWALPVFIISATSGCFFIILNVTSLVIQISSTHGRSHGAIFDRMKREAIESWELISQLRQQPKHLVEYAFSQFSAQWEAMSVRASLLTGDFLRLGLLPALAATITAAAALAKQGSNIYLWMPIAMVAIGYIMVFMAMASREGVRQSTLSVKYLLTHWDEMPSPNPEPPAGSYSSDHRLSECG